jgi:hypothetical protein
MSTGNYGTIRPADVSVDDIEMFYHKTASRDDVSDTILQPLDPSELLVKVDNPNNAGEIFGGLYTLKLPTSIFGSKGIYTIIIRPKQIRTTIVDCGVLASNSDVVGMVLDYSSIPASNRSSFENGQLVGHRIEYLNTNSSAGEKKINNLFRVVTSNNRAEAVSENLSNSSQKSIRYRFNDNSTLVYCTLTPSSAPSVNPNALPYIGQPGQQIIITNTFFNPIMLEVEMVEHDDETLAFALYGNQSKSLEDGIYSIYNFENAIYRQYNLYEVKDQFTGKPLYEIREEKDNVDFTKDFGDITDF